MFMCYKYLRQHPRVFRSMTGLTVPEFNHLMTEVAPLTRPLSGSGWLVQTGFARLGRATPSAWITETNCC
ncbi:MAG: hypothetical protein WBW48_06495 [Anaerolineae bacterium]